MYLGRNIYMCVGICAQGIAIYNICMYITYDNILCICMFVYIRMCVLTYIYIYIYIYIHNIYIYIYH